MIHDVELAIVQALANTITTYPDEAPVKATYPYAVVSCKRLTIEENVGSWRVEINVWDKHEHNSRAEAKMDAIEKVLDFSRIMLTGSNAGTLVCLYKSQREDILDTDETIKRVRTQFDTTIYESEA